MLGSSENAQTTVAGSVPVTAAAAKFKLIERAIEEIRPYLRADGGDCELISVEGDIVKVQMRGACVHCQMASVTINGVQERLIDKLGMPLRIIPVRAPH
jgi:NifU-like protein